MGDRVRPTVEGFDAFHSPRLSPAEGLESSSLYTAPPIESLELLKELGDIAAASISATARFLDESAAEVTDAMSAAGSTAAPAATSPTPPAPVATPPRAKGEPTSDDRLMEALLEYHRLRGPKLGARTAPRPSADTEFARVDASSDPGERFAPVEIPVVQDFVPKTSPTGRPSRPVQTILKPKSRS